MAKYVYTYHGGSMASTPEEQKASMEAWMQWFAGLGDKVIDNGNPFMPGAKEVTKDKVSQVSGGAATGYSIVEAGSLDEACALVGDCPILKENGSVQVYEAIPM